MAKAFPKDSRDDIIGRFQTERKAKFKHGGGFKVCLEIGSAPPDHQTMWFLIFAVVASQLTTLKRGWWCHDRHNSAT